MKQAGMAFCLLLFLLSCLGGCSAPGKKEASTVIVFKHGKMAGSSDLFRLLLDRFEAATPGIRVKDETLPSSTDEQHQFYVINLEGRSSDFDALSIDVIWVPEFARAGWLRILDGLLPPDVTVLSEKPRQVLEAEVLLTEPAGSFDWVDCLWKGFRILGMTRPGAGFEPGSRVYISFRPDRVHLFDTRSGQRVEQQAHQ